MAIANKLVAFGWANPQQYAANIWIKYNISLEQFNRFWTVQEGKCAGCRGTLAHPIHKSFEIGLKPEIDHNHQTKQVRGLLCRRCNDFLGKVKDNQDTLKNLIEYLKQNGEHIL